MVALGLLVPEELVEPVSDALIDGLGALSVSVEDADAGADAERPLFGEPGLPPPRPGWQRSTLTALFTTDAQATEAATLLLAQDWTGDVQVRALETVPDEDWVKRSQAQFEPLEITPSFWIVPSWREPPPGATTVIRLDPGLAFGTGSHPTTRMCLRWIAEHAQPWPRVLDYGSGSGILAIAAALHGARSVDAVDIDPAAIAATHANARANGVALDAGGPDIASGRYDLVLANILSTPLKLLAPLLAERVAPAGQLVLAGILERQADELVAAYAPWCSLRVADRADGWVLMTARFVSAP
jgi:ribosomal protein L11 methyltransferase